MNYQLSQHDIENKYHFGFHMTGSDAAVSIMNGKFHISPATGHRRLQEEGSILPQKLKMFGEKL